MRKVFVHSMKQLQHCFIWNYIHVCDRNATYLTDAGYHNNFDYGNNFSQSLSNLIESLIYLFKFYLQKKLKTH